jgi:hypothetical protein
VSHDWKTAIDWPAEGYIDPDTGRSHAWTDPVQVPPVQGERTQDADTGRSHAWTDPVPDDDGVVHPEDGYTYQDLVADQAEAHGMEIGEFLDHLALQRGDGDEKLSPPWVDDGDGWG